MSEGKIIRMEPDRVNPFAVTGVDRSNQASGMMQVASSRHAQEVQAAMAIAKRFPRNEEEAFNRIMRSCKRPILAENASYAYPRGDTTVTGPSVELAREVARSWGNIDFGIVELEQKDGESTMMAFAWDLETNTRETRVFTVKHERTVGKGANKRLDRLTDPRDIYEMTANMGSRRMRACILGVLPGDIIDAALEECDKTLKGDKKEPLIDRVRRMALSFQEDCGVSVAMLEKRLQHKLEATIEQELVSLRKIYKAIRDGFGKREDYFELVDTVKAPEGVSTTDAPARTTQPEQSNAQAAPAPAEASETAAEAPTANVPNETLGEAKPKRAKPAPEPGSRAALVEELRNRFVDSGVSEKEVIATCVRTGRLSANVTSLTALGSDLLKAMIEDYSNIIKEIE